MNDFSQLFHDENELHFDAMTIISVLHLTKSLGAVKKQDFPLLDSIRTKDMRLNIIQSLELSTRVFIR